MVSLTKVLRDAALQEAVAALLEACELDRFHKDLTDTPARVAKTWAEQFLCGYQMRPSQILSGVVRGEGDTELVVVRDLPFHGMCPHHLMPYTGMATLAYLPSETLVGFGRLAELVRCFTARLTLQERACNEIVDALMLHLGARGAGCVMQGEHMCLRIADNRHAASVVTASFRGELKTRPGLQDRLMA